MPLFSIIIPVYNGAETIREALESVRKQSFTDFELILVDDGSTDKSGEIIEEVIVEWNQAKLVSQENKGLGAARNAAAKLAKSEWLTFLDADDYWAADRLQVLSGDLQQGNEDLIYHAIYEKYADGNLRKRTFNPVQNLAEFIQLGNPFVPSALAIKRQLFWEAGGFIEDRNQVEDLLLWFRLLKKGISIHAINRPLTVYRIGSGVTADLEGHLRKVFAAMHSAENEGILDVSQVETLKQQKYLEAARQLHKLGEFTSAIKYYEKVNTASFKTRVLQFFCRLGVAI